MPISTNGIRTPSGDESPSDVLAQWQRMAQDIDAKIRPAFCAEYASTVATVTGELWGVGQIALAPGETATPGVTTGNGFVTLAPGWYEFTWLMTTANQIQNPTWMSLRLGGAGGQTFGYTSVVGSAGHFTGSCFAKKRVASSTQVHPVVWLTAGANQTVNHRFTIQRLGD